MNQLPSIMGAKRLQVMEAEMLKLPQVDCPVEHFFVDGLYTRQISIPAGTLLVGYTHTQPCITTLSKGRILIADGESSIEFKAPMTMTCAAGTKKAGYAIEDSVWADTYLNLDNERDPNKLKAKLTQGELQ